MSNVKQSENLIELAKNAMSKGVMFPYSHFQVGAAILTKSGKFYSGCNVENAAYPEGTCAEAGAIASMVLDGETQIKDIYVIGHGDALVTPCGGCRQKIREFSSADTMIHILWCARRTQNPLQWKHCYRFRLGLKTLNSKKETTKQRTASQLRFDVSIKKPRLTWFFCFCVLFIDRTRQRWGR